MSLRTSAIEIWESLKLAEWIFPSTSMKRRTWPLLIGVTYIMIIGALGGLRSDHIMMGLLPLLDFYNQKSRAFLRTFLPFILTGIVFDSMRYYYWAGVSGHIYVAEPYYRDLHLFGIPNGSARLTPNEFFALHPSVILDLLCGFAYLTFVAEYLAAGFYLFLREKWHDLKVFGWSFFVVNVLGFITYFIYPAAPPWYVREYGLGPARMDVRPSAAFAHRFDELLNTHFFDEMYGRGIDVYGAYPSLHVAYPLLTCWVVFMQPELKAFRIPAIGFYLLMCISAVYLQHHYVMDILLGTAYATITVLVMKKAVSASAIQPVA